MFSIPATQIVLNLSWWRSLSYRNQSIDLLCKRDSLSLKFTRNFHRFRNSFEKDRPIHTMYFDSIPDSYKDVFQEEKFVFNTLQCLSPFCAIRLFLYPLKTSKNLWLSDVFRGYRKTPKARNKLKTLWISTRDCSYIFWGIVKGLEKILNITLPSESKSQWLMNKICYLIYFSNYYSNPIFSR